jgi:hypothetical protein
VQLEQLLGRKIDAVLCGEAGGVNSTTPFVVAAMTGLPLVDGDGMGRAYPELQMVTFTMHGVSATPMVLCDDKGNSLVLETVSNAWTERLARAATVEMGGSALLAFYLDDRCGGEEGHRARHADALRQLGLTLREAKAGHVDPVNAIVDMLGAEVIFHGRIKDIERRTVGGFARGTARFEGVEDWKGQLQAGFPERVPDGRARRRDPRDHPGPDHRARGRVSGNCRSPPMRCATASAHGAGPPLQSAMAERPPGSRSSAPATSATTWTIGTTSRPDPADAAGQRRHRLAACRPSRGLEDPYAAV